MKRDAYLKAALCLNPDHDPNEILQLRADFHGLDESEEDCDAAADTAYDLLKLLREHFWGIEAPVFYEQLIPLDLSKAPRLAAHRSRLQEIYVHRTDFLRLRETRDRAGRRFLDYFAQVLTEDDDDSANLKFLFLQKRLGFLERRRIKAVVRRIKQVAPAYYQRESAWLTEITHPRRFLRMGAWPIRWDLFMGFTTLCMLILCIFLVSACFAMLSGRLS